MSLSDLICKRLHVSKTFVTDWVQHTARIVPKACFQYHIPPSWSWNATASGCSPYCCFASQSGTQRARSPWWTRGECEGCRSWRKQRRKSPPDRLATSSKFLMEARKTVGKKHVRPRRSSSESLCKFRKSSLVDVFLFLNTVFLIFQHVWLMYESSSMTSNLVTPCDTLGRWHCWRMPPRGCAAKSCTALPWRRRRMTAMPPPWQRKRRQPKRSQLSQKLRKKRRIFFPEMKSWLWWSWHVDDDHIKSVVITQDMLVELNVSTPEGSTAGSPELSRQESEFVPDWHEENQWKSTKRTPWNPVGKLWWRRICTENFAVEVAWHPWRSCKQLWIRWPKRRPQTRQRKTLLCRHWWPSTRRNREWMRIWWEFDESWWDFMMFSWSINVWQWSLEKPKETCNFSQKIQSRDITDSDRTLERSWGRCRKAK